MEMITPSLCVLLQGFMALLLTGKLQVIVWEIESMKI